MESKDKEKMEREKLLKYTSSLRRLELAKISSNGSGLQAFAYFKGRYLKVFYKKVF